MFSIKGLPKGLAVMGLVLAAAASASGQRGDQEEGISRAQVAVDYSYMRANAAPGDCGCFNLNGGSAEVAVRAYRNFSAVFDLTGEHAGTTSIPGQSLSLLSYTGGPRFSYPLHRGGRMRLIPFVQGLVGAMHGFDGQFPNHSGALSSSATDLAILVGGGLDLQVKHRFAVRVVQVDYGHDQLPNNANNSENLLRVSAGVVLRLR
jgi:outer membrane immunogenic protein